MRLNTYAQGEAGRWDGSWEVEVFPSGELVRVRHDAEVGVLVAADGGGRRFVRRGAQLQVVEVEE